jgi:hypothetical protein
MRLGLCLASGPQLLVGFLAGTAGAATWLFADFGVIGVLLLAVAAVLLLDRSRATPGAGS